MEPTFIPNRARLLELCDKPDGIAQWARETLEQYDRLRGALGALEEIDAEGARLDWQEAKEGKQGAADRQAAVRILRKLPGGITSVARYLEVSLDDLAARTWPGSDITGDQLLLVEELAQDPTVARRAIGIAANVSLPWLDSYLGIAERNTNNRQIRALITECFGDGLSLDETREALSEAGHQVPYKRVWETYTRLSRKEASA